MTSAPRSASRRAPKAADTSCPTSMQRTPASGRNCMFTCSRKRGLRRLAEELRVEGIRDRTAAALWQHERCSAGRALLAVLVLEADLDLHEPQIATRLLAGHAAPRGERIARHIHAAVLEV